MPSPSKKKPEPPSVPKQVDVCGVVLKVRIITHKDADKDDWGNFDHDKGEIAINEAVFNEDSPTTLHRTLVHEVIHAWLEYTGLGYTLFGYEESEREAKEEGLVRSLEYLLEPALRRIWEDADEG